MRSLPIRIVITTAVVIFMLRCFSTLACMNWPDFGCQFWADFASNCLHAVYWRVAGVTAGAFLMGAFLAGLAAWAYLSPEEDSEADRRAIGQEVLAEALRRTKAKVAVPAEVEKRFTVRFWDRLSSFFKF